MAIRGTEWNGQRHELCDIILATTGDETDGQWYPLMLARGERGERLIRTGRVVPTSHRVSRGLDDRDPPADLSWTQDDWQGGALVEKAEIVSNGYQHGTMDAAFPGQLGPGIGRNFGSGRGNTRTPIPVALHNPHFEAPSGDEGWTDDSGANGTVDFDNTTAPRTSLFGNQSCEVVATGAAAMFSQALANPTVWQGKSLSVSVYFKRTAGAGGIRVNIVESGGSGGTTNGTTITASDWTVSTATATIDAGTTAISIQVEATGAGTFYCDDASVYSGTSLAATRVAVLGTAHYAAFGRMVCKLATGTDDAYRWNVVYVHASASVTDIIAFGGNVYVAFGASNAYIYGSDTSWTTSTLTSTAKNAIKWAVSRTTLWKSETVNTIKSATDPTNSGSWSTAYTVGSSDHEITALHDHEDTVLVGKEDGLWKYHRVYEDGASADLFENQTNEFRTFPSTDNFRVAALNTDNGLYMPTAAPGFVRVLNGNLQGLDVFAHPEAGAKGNVRALAADPHQLWAFVDDRLYAVTQQQGRLVPHTRGPGPSVSPASGAEFGTLEENTGATLAGTGADGGGGSLAWTNPTNVTADDGTYATNTLQNAPDNTNYLHATNFSFAIPDGATILGVEVTFEAKKSDATQSIWIDDVYLIKGGSRAGNNLEANVSPITTSDVVYTYGGAAALAGLSLGTADVNASNFGVAIRFLNTSGSAANTTSVDYIKIKVYYSRTPNASDAVFPRHAAAVWWTVDSLPHPHLLGLSSGLDSEDNIPYAITDCWALPRTAVAPALDAEDLPASPTTQTFVTSRWNGGMPATLKYGERLDVLLEEMDATQPVTVKIGVNGADPGTGAELGTLDGSDPLQSLFFNDLDSPESQALFYDVALCFEGTYSGSRNKRLIKAFRLSAQAVDESYRTWAVTVHKGGAVLYNGTRQDIMVSRAALEAFLRTIETRDYPFKLIEDEDHDGEATETLVKIRPGTVADDGSTWSAVLQEASTS